MIAEVPPPRLTQPLSIFILVYHCLLAGALNLPDSVVFLHVSVRSLAHLCGFLRVSIVKVCDILVTHVTKLSKISSRKEASKEKPKAVRNGGAGTAV